jgi:hypothetical protein
MQGWIFNLDLREPAYNRIEERDQQPIFYNAETEAVFEVWFFHRPLQRWFVMSAEANPQLEAQGVVFFHPSEVPEQLRARVHALEKQAGLDPATLPRKSCRTS